MCAADHTASKAPTTQGSAQRVQQARIEQTGHQDDEHGSEQHPQLWVLGQRQGGFKLINQIVRHRLPFVAPSPCTGRVQRWRQIVE